MTMQTIVLLGGVVALLLMLLVVRRRRAAASASPPAREEASSHVPERISASQSGPIPLYAAESTPDVAVHGGLPPAEAPPMQNWSDGAVVTEPGWLMPGELEHAWQADFAMSAAPAGSGADAHEAKASHAGHGNGNGHGSGAPDMAHLITDVVTDFDPASGWGAEPSGPMTIEMDRPDPDDEPRIPEWDSADDAAGPSGPAIDLTVDDEVSSWSEVVVEEPYAEAPVAAQDEVASWSEVVVEEPAAEAPVAAQEVPSWSEIVEEAVASQDEIPSRPEPVVEDSDAETSMPSWSEMEFVPERELVTPAAPAPEPWTEFAMDSVEVAEEPVSAEPAEPVVAWWDLPDPEPVVEEQDAATAEPATGRFALGGFALKPGQEAIAGVSFRSPLATAPTGWTVAGDHDGEPGTLVLQVDGAVNCGPEELAVLTDAGFAPTPEGFTISIAARAPGPFAASGTFRVS